MGPVLIWPKMLAVTSEIMYKIALYNTLNKIVKQRIIVNEKCTYYHFQIHFGMLEIACHFCNVHIYDCFL